jgi:tetratricopeptide (TPR) repeat protein
LFGVRKAAKARRKRPLILIVVLCLGTASVRIAMAEEPSDADAAEIISKENLVDSLTPPDVWQPASVGQKLAWHDRLRTGEDSRTAVRLSDSSILRLDELTEAEVLPPPSTTTKPTVDLKQGTAYFFSREKSREINVQTPAANGTIRGTEFVVTVADNGATSFIMIDGEVETSNGNGSLVVRSGERADIEPGGTPARTEVINPIESARWCFYYPAVLDPKELMASIEEGDPLHASLAAYSEGDLLMALQQYPPDRSPASPEEKVYRAGLLLFAGQVAKAEALLGELDDNVRYRQALSTLIAAVTLKDRKRAESPKTASEWIAESYYLQSIDHLVGARQAAERATALDPDFGFGWTRVAELELGQNRTSQAKKALEKGFGLAPRNPAAHALRGFILSAEDKLDDAKDSFERALALDGSLGDAWLGRGLCLIRQGYVKAGRRDILTAAALEPNRAIFRSYLDQDFDDSGGKTKTQKGRAPRPGIIATPGPYYPGLIPPPNITAGPRPYYPGRTSRPVITASPQPGYPGRTSRPVVTDSPKPDNPEPTPRPRPTPSPKPDYPKRTPRPEITASPKPSRPERTPRPKPTMGSILRRPQATPSPTPSKLPPQGQQIRQPKPTPPARSAIVPGSAAAREQIKGRTKRPGASPSPIP